MGCDLTEQVSLLVDGEMEPREAARLSAHIEGCASCQQSRAAILLLRRGLRSYELPPCSHAHAKALASILGSGSRPDAPTPQGLPVGLPSNPRRTVWRMWERLAEAFGGRRLRPAHAATLALLLIVSALGVRWFVGPRAPSHTPLTGDSVTENVNGSTAQATQGSSPDVKRPVGPEAADGSAVYGAEASKRVHSAATVPHLRGRGRAGARDQRVGYRTGRRGGEAPGRDPRREAARTVTAATQLQPPSSGAGEPFAAASFRASAADPSPGIGRHAERVERLFRSLRNARLTENDPTLEVVDARRRSKGLLYSNIALRREAAGAGDRPLEGLLDSLEPILLDISNLPDGPSPETIGSIKERIRRQQLVGVLQVRGMLASVSRRP